MEIYPTNSASQFNSLIFIDIRSAFDSLTWRRLFNYLAEQKFPTDIIATIQVLYHSTHLAINRSSNKIIINKGTPQGGILSPELFIRYFNPILRDITSPSHKYVFADDLSASNQSKQQLL